MCRDNRRDRLITLAEIRFSPSPTMARSTALGFPVMGHSGMSGGKLLTHTLSEGSYLIGPCKSNEGLSKHRELKMWHRQRFAWASIAASRGRGLTTH